MTDRKDKFRENDIKLRKHIEKQDFVKINRTFNDREENISGFILLVSQEFLLLQIDNEFMLDGYAIIPKHQIDSIRCNKYDLAFKKIYKAEGLLNTQYGINQPISLKSWQDIFTALKKLDYHVIIECENKVEPDFIIGPVRKIYKDKVSVQYYDPTGKLEDKLTSVKYDEITIVKFGDRYTTTFKKHLR